MRCIQTCLSVQFSGSGIIQHVSGRGPVGLLDPRAASCSALTWGNGASGKHGQHRGQHRPYRYLTTGQTASWLPPGKEDCWARQAAQSLSIQSKHEFHAKVPAHAAEHFVNLNILTALKSFIWCFVMGCASHETFASTFRTEVTEISHIFIKIS